MVHNRLYFLLLAFLPLILIIFYFIARNNLKRQGRVINMRLYYEALNGLSNHLPGKVSKYHKLFFNEPSFSGNFLGHVFTVTFWKSELVAPFPSKLILTCYSVSASKLKIFIYKKDPGTVLFAKEIYTGDKDIDRFFIYSNRPDEARGYFSDMSRRTAIKQIVNNGWEPPMITGNKITVESFEPKPELDPEFIQETLKMMITLQS